MFLKSATIFQDMYFFIRLQSFDCLFFYFWSNFFAFSRPPLPDLRRPERQPSQRPFLQPGNDLERFQIKENTPVGEAVYTLKGVDPKGMCLFKIFNVKRKIN